MARKVCPTLPDTGRALDVLDRTLRAAAQVIDNFALYGDITQRERQDMSQCIAEMEAYRQSVICR